jgi:hypothetical protein
VEKVEVLEPSATGGFRICVETHFEMVKRPEMQDPLTIVVPIVVSPEAYRARREAELSWPRLHRLMHEPLDGVAEAETQFVLRSIQGMRRPWRPKDPTAVVDSVFDASGLGYGWWGVGAGVGFPYTSIVAGLGIASGVSLRFALSAFLWSSISGHADHSLQPSVGAQVRLTDGASRDRIQVALRAGFGYTFHEEPADSATRGERWTTGDRDGFLVASLVASITRSHGVVWFAEAGASVNTTEIDGTPALDGGKFLFRMGVERPLVSGGPVRCNLLGILGTDLHTRPVDSLAMPFALVGLSLASGE